MIDVIEGDIAHTLHEMVDNWREEKKLRWSLHGEVDT